MTPDETLKYLQVENNPDLWELYALKKEIFRHYNEINGRMKPEIVLCMLHPTSRNKGMKRFLMAELRRRQLFDIPYCRFEIWRLERRVKLRDDVSYETWIEVDR